MSNLLVHTYVRIWVHMHVRTLAVAGTPTRLLQEEKREEAGGCQAVGICATQLQKQWGKW